MWLDIITALMLFGLVLVLAWWTTRFVSIRMGAAGGRGRSLRVLEHIPAGRDRSILLLEVGGRVYLVGATTQQISLLDAIEDPGTIARILEKAAPAPDAPMLPLSFQDVLNRVRGRQAHGPATVEQVPAAAAESPEEEPAADRLKHQLDRLRRLQTNPGEEERL